MFLTGSKCRSGITKKLKIQLGIWNQGKKHYTSNPFSFLPEPKLDFPIDYSLTFTVEKERKGVRQQETPKSVRIGIMFVAAVKREDGSEISFIGCYYRNHRLNTILFQAQTFTSHFEFCLIVGYCFKSTLNAI